MRKAKPDPPIASTLPPGLRQGGILAAGSIAASALTTLSTLVATVIILRVLPHEAAGRYAFLVELLYGVGLVCSLGQAVLQARLYHQSGANNFDWVRDAWSTTWITLPVVTGTIAAIARPYNLTLLESVILISGAGFFILTSCFSAVLAQARHYAWASALLRLGNGLLIIPAALMFAVPSLRRLDFVLVCLLVFIGSVTILGAFLLARWLRRGPQQITLRQRISGLVFLATVLALVVPQRGLLVVAGAMLKPETVAALAAVVSILRVFDLVGESAGRVFSTEMARHSRSLTAGLLAAPWLLGASMGAAVLIGLPAVIHRFYGGRYDEALPLLPWLVLAAAFRLVEMIPRGFLAYLAPASLLNRFAAVQCATAVAGIALMVLWTARTGINGLVWAATLVAAVRLTISYFFLITLRAMPPALATAGKDLVVEPVEVGGEETPV